MTDKYDLSSIDTLPAAPTSAPSKYDLGGIDAMPAASGFDKTASLFAASIGNPSEEAERRRLESDITRITGFREPVADIREATRRRQQLEADHVTRASPRTSLFLSVPENAAVAIQDAKTMAQIEAIIGGDPARALEITAKRLAMAPANLGAWGFDVAAVVPDIAGEGLAAVGLPNEYNVFRDMASGSRRHATAARAAVDYFTPEARNMVERAAASAGTSAGTSLQLLPLAMSGAGAPMALAFGLGTFGESYTKAREQGKNPIQALQYAIPQGAYEALFEMAPAAFLADALKTAPGLKQFVTGLAAREVPTEMATTVAQNLNDWVTFNPNKSVADFIAEQPEALAETIIATVMGAGVQAGIIHGAQRTTGQFQQMQEERRAKQLQETLTGLMDQAKNVKSDPVTFQNFMAGVTDNATVFINADALQDTLAQNKMDVSVLPSLAEQLAQPSVTGDVEVPIGELMTAFAGTPAQEQVVQHARVRQDDLSAAEQAQFGDMGAFFKKQGEAVMEKQKANEQFVSEVKAIEDELTKELEALPPLREKPFKPHELRAQARVIASMYGALADMAGMSPAEARAMTRPNILGPDGAAPPRAATVTLGAPSTISWRSGKYTFTETRTYEHRADDGRVSRTTVDEDGNTKKEWLIVKKDGAEVWSDGDQLRKDDDYANVTPQRAQEIANEDLPAGATGETTDTAPSADNLSQGFDHGKPMVNIGLDIGDQQNALSKEDAIAMLQNLGVTVTDSNVLNLTHEWGNENTLVAHLDKPLTPEQMTQLMADTQQEAIPQYEGGVGTLYHATPEAAAKWGPFNPEYFRDLEGVSLLDAQKVLAQKKTKTPKITEIVKGQKLEQSTPLTAKQWADVRDIALEGLNDDEKTAWLQAEQEVLAGVEEANRNSDVLKEIAKTALDKMPVPRVSTVPLLAGRLKLKIEPTGNFRKDGSRKTRVPDVARALFNKFRNAKASVETPEGREIMARAMAHEALYALSQDGHAVGWYDRKVREAIMTFALVHPEVLTSPRHNLAFRLIAAITSNGQTVRDNFILANDIYNLWSKEQVFPTEFAFDESQADQEVDEDETPPAEGFEGGGPRKPAMVAAFKKINVLVKELGWDAIESEMLQLRTVRDVEKEFGLKIGGENKDTVIPTAVGLGGPKIGNFFANLSGYFDSPTMDLWFMRTAGRMEGSLLETKPALVEHLDELLTLLPEDGEVKGQSVATLRKEIEKYKALDKEAQLDAETTLKTLKHVSTYARAQFSQFASPHPDTGKTYWDKSDANVNARRLVNNLAAVREAPSSGGERNNLRAVVTRAMELLEKQGISLTAADLQAVLWYHEKNLYSKLGDISASAKPWDYASAARFSVGRELGLVDVGSRQRAEAVPAGQPAAGGPGGLGAVQGLGQEDQGGALAQAVRSAGAVAGPVVGIHYSKAPRTTLSSGMSGQGMKGAEAERIAASKDPRIKQRVNFYVNTGSGITPESDVGANPHVATLRNLYDADADALKIWRNSKGDMNAAESAVLDAGFDGYLTRNFGGTGAAVMLGSRNVDVQSVKREDVDTVAELPPSAEIPRMKQAALAIMQNRSLPFGQQSVESWKRDLERSDPDTAALIDWAKIPAGDYYKDQIAGQLWQTTFRPVDTNAPEFKAWARDAEVLERDDTFSHDFVSEQPVVVQVIHGTTGDFTTFDRDRAAVESDMGAGIYATNDELDASANYAGEGPDLTNRLEYRAEQIESFLEDDDSMEGKTRDEIRAEAKRRAREELAVQNQGFAMPVWMRFEKPFVLGGPSETQMTYETLYDEETDEYGEETGTLVDFIVELRSVAEQYSGGELEGFVGALLEKAADGVVSATELFEAASNAEMFYYFENNEGQLVSKEIIRQTLENLGYDGIIDQTVDAKFGSSKKRGQPMRGVTQDTKHFIVFSPEQIKSAISNTGEFSDTNPNILFAEAAGPRRGSFNPLTFDLRLLADANRSTFIHEASHFFMAAYIDMASQPDAPPQLKEFVENLLGYLFEKVPGGTQAGGEGLGQKVLADLTETLFFPQTSEEKKQGYANRLKNPVTLKDGTRLSGFTDPIRQSTFLGYDKNGGPITIRREYVNPGDIVFSKDSNKTAEKLREGLRNAQQLAQEVGAGGTAPRLAPNGKPSKLTERQWLQVRTPEFKAWFGDWEKHAKAANPVGSLWSDDSVSKIVDENGEPLVVYHGTQQGGFDIFRPEKGDKHRSPMVFATDDRRTARTYSGRGDEIDFDEQFKVVAVGDQFIISNTTYPAEDEVAYKYDSREDAQDDADEMNEDGAKAGIYELFLNIRNPNEADFEGANWDGQWGYDDWQVVDADQETQYTSDGRGVMREHEARQFLEQLGGEEAGYAVIRPDSRLETTNSVAEDALRMKMDGAIIRNVVDDGGQYSSADASDVFVFFDSNQVKSATQNDGAFSIKNDSILHQDGQPSTPGPLPAGRTNLERWNAMTLDQQRPYWEHFAEQWEQYAMTGKAPTKALQAAFSAFAKWMKSVYQSFKNFLLQNPQAKPLDPEITQYFDRMLATEAELDAAREERGYKALFKAAADAGMSPSQFADYMALDELQKTEANELLLSRSLRDMKWLSNAKSKAIKEIQAEADELRALVRASVEEELADTPIRKAERWLRKGEMVQDGEQIKATAGFKLNAEIVKAMFPQGAVDSVDLAKLKQMMSSTGTQHPDDVAAIFGFRNGETLVRELLELQPFKDEAQQLTDLRMLEEHGDLATPEAIEKAADAAIHNAAHLKMVATEVWALNNRIGSVAALTKAAKEFAKNLIGNTTVKKLSPSSYANAATRAGKMASRAVAKKETDVAAREKRMEMINAAAAKEAYAAEAEVRAMMNRLRKIAAYSDKHSSVTSREFSVVQAVRAILGEFEIGSKGEKAQTYVATVSEYDPMLGARLKEVIDTLTASPKPWAELTVDELRELHAEIGGLWTLAREIRTVELAGEKMTLDEARQQLLDKLSENRKAGKDGKAFSLTDAEIRNQDFMSFVARGVRPESWISMKDGNEQYGPWRRLIWNAIDRAQLGYNADKADKLKQLKALLETVAADMKDVQIDAPELGGTFGAGNVIGYSELLHAILHTGNESNKTKLLVGRGWGGIREDGTLDSTKWDAFMKRMWAEGKITKTHMDFVQGIWDLMESMKEGAQKAHRATTGRYFEEIQATEIVTPFGTYRGGYVPAIVDRRLVADADVRKALEESQTDVLQTFEKPAGGFTKSRVKNYNSKLELNIAALGRHIDQVMLFTHMSVPVRNVQRVLRGPALSKELSEQDRSALTKVIMPWLHGAATQTVTERGSMSYENLELLTKARSRAGAALMFANISNSVQQLTGFFPALLKTDSKELLFAAAKGWYKPRELAAHVSELSPYMKQRLDNEVHAMAEEIDHILLNPTRFEKAQDWAIAHSYFLQMAVDSAMSPVIWQAKFNETIARGGSQQEAVDLADSAVRMTQGSNRAIDIAAMERGSPFYRLFMQFAGYFNTQINLVGEKLAAAKTLPSVPAKYGRIGMVLWLGWLAPAIASALVVQLFRGGVEDDDDDGEWLDDWLTATLIGAPFKYAAAAVPVFGQTIVAAMNSFNDKPYDDRISMSPAVSIVEGGYRGGKALIGAFEDPTKAGRAIRDIGTFMSLFTGVPVTPATKAIGYATDVETGKVSPTGPVDYGRGIITGTASPESKR